MQASQTTHRLIRLLFALYRSLKGYGLLPSGCCRYRPTCSDYARQALLAHGVVAGGRMALARFLRCRPGQPGGVDPMNIYTTN